MIERAAFVALCVLSMLPQDPATDRAAMDLFQNWNFAPWEGRL